MSDASRNDSMTRYSLVRFLAARIARARLLLNERVLIPHEMIAPGPRRRIGMAVDDRAIHALRLVALELLLQPRLRVGALGEHDEPRGVAVDAVHDERPPLAARAEMILDFLVHRRRVASALERDDEQPGRLVQDQQRVILVDDAEIARRPDGGTPLRRAGPVHPDADDVAGVEARARGVGAGLHAVDEHLAARDRRGRRCAREPRRSGAARNLSSRVADASAPAVHSVSSH